MIWWPSIRDLGLGQRRGLLLLSDQQRTGWLKRNVVRPEVWGQTNPCGCGYRPSMGSQVRKLGS